MLNTQERDYIEANYGRICARLAGSLKRRRIVADPDALNEAIAWFCRLFSEDSLRRKRRDLSARENCAIWFSSLRVCERRPAAGCLHRGPFIDALDPAHKPRREQLNRERSNPALRSARELRLEGATV